MAQRQIHHVNIVAHSGTVGRGVIVAPYVQCFTPAGSHLGYKGQQVVGDALWVFANKPTGVCTHGVEIAQITNAPCGVALVHIAKHVFYHQLGLPVGVGGRQGVRLTDGQVLWVTIHRSRRAEHQCLYSTFVHGLQQAHSTHHVVIVVVQGVCYRFTHSLQAGKMNDCMGTTLFQCSTQRRTVADIALDKGHLFSCDALHPCQRLTLAVAQIVIHGDFLPRLEQFHTGVTTDIPRSAGYKNHGKLAF